MVAPREIIGLSVLCLASSIVEGWSSRSQQPCCTYRSKHQSPSALLATDRRTFFAATTAATTGAIVGSIATPAQAAPLPEGADLVVPGSLVGQTVVITGASTGLGLETARDLARGGATVVLTARSDTKGSKAVSSVQDYLRGQGIENPNVSYVTLDLDDLNNVKGFSTRYKERMGGKTIDCLINNAGVMAIPERQVTKDGYERTFQSNHLGHFALTSVLEPLLNKNARIINVSSLAYNIANGPLDFDNLNSENSYGPWKSYGASKLANILFAQELQRRAKAAQKSYVVVSLHPGAVNTDLARNFVGEEKWNTPPSTILEKGLKRFIEGVLLTPEQGAATQVYLAATTDRIEPGAFYNNLKPERLPSFATDAEEAKRLWEASEQLAGVKFDL